VANRVIVVDDDHSILDLLATLLENEGYQVQALDSGEAAHRAAITEHPDAAVVDLMMPGMNGLELIKALRADPRTRAIPILLCSAYYGDLRQITYQLDRDGQENVYYLRKPFRIQDVLDLVERMVSSGKTESLPNGAIT